MTKIRPHIVSLLPSATEVLFSLGLDHQLVGRSHLCDFPLSVASLPICTRPRTRPLSQSPLNLSDPSALLHAALSHLEVDLPQTRNLKPTHIITNKPLDVWGVSPAQLDEAAQLYFDEPPKIIRIGPRTLQGVFDSIFDISSHFESIFQAEDLVTQLSRRLNHISARARETANRPRVVIIENLFPLRSAGLWVPELAFRAGATQLYSQIGQPHLEIRIDQLVERDPDFIILACRGQQIRDIRENLRSLPDKGQLRRLTAFKEGRIFIVDGLHFFNRPSTRIIDSFEILAEILHPSEFLFGHEHQNWERL